MILAVVYQNTLPKAVDCVSVSTEFQENILIFKNDFDHLNSDQEIININTTLS